METVLMIIAALSLVAFVVGMFSPKTVKWDQRKILRDFKIKHIILII